MVHHQVAPQEKSIIADEENSPPRKIIFFSPKKEDFSWFAENGSIWYWKYTKCKCCYDIFSSKANIAVCFS